MAKDNNLKPGDVMVFVLVRDSRFHFTVFDEKGNQIGTGMSFSTQNDAVAKKEPSCSPYPSSRSNNPDLVQHPKTMKRLFESPGSDPSPATHHQIAQSKQKNFEAVCRSEKLATKEDGSISRDPKPATKNVKTTKGASQLRGARSGDSQKSSPVPTVLVYGAIPRFESLDPFAFSIKSRRRVTTALERQTAEDAAMAHAKSLTGPHFVCVMSETQVYREFQLVSIPIFSAKECFNPCHFKTFAVNDPVESVQVLPDSFVAESCFPTVATQWRLRDCAGNSWEMYSMKSRRNEITLHRKFWAPFSVHHLLEDGDVCVFEKSEPLAIRVHIFRVVPISTDNISVHAHYDMRELD